MKINKKVVPHIFTFANLCLGMLAIMFALTGEHHVWSVVGSSLVILAAILDRYDGKIARWLDVESDLGKELDSLSDLVSFGLAPAIITWNLALSHHLGWIWVEMVIALIFLSAGAYRLARYNITVMENNTFTGIPITVAGSLLGLYNIYIVLADVVNTPIVAQFTVFFMLSLSYLMVSKLKIKKR